MNKSYQIQHLQEDQIKSASKVLARAFHDDPLFIYFYPDPVIRKIKSINICEFSILYGIQTGEVYLTSSDIQGVAIWVAFFIKDQKLGNQSNDIKRRWRKVRRNVFSDPLFAEKYNIYQETLNSFQDEHMNFPHWDLAMIGVDPKHQGKGYASMLIKAKLEELDTQNLPCSLNTENEGNVALYEHFGFELVEKKIVPNTNYHIYTMLRKKKK